MMDDRFARRFSLIGAGRMSTDHLRLGLGLRPSASRGSSTE